jgi:hypothetical protein
MSIKNFTQTKVTLQIHQGTIIQILQQLTVYINYFMTILSHCLQYNNVLILVRMFYFCRSALDRIRSLTLNMCQMVIFCPALALCRKLATGSKLGRLINIATTLTAGAAP